MSYSKPSSLKTIGAATRLAYSLYKRQRPITEYLMKGRNAKRARVARRVATRTTTTIKRKRRNRRRQNRGRTKRYIKPSAPSTGVIWKQQNVASISFDNADYIAVLSGVAAALGKRCKYGYVGCSQPDYGGVASLLSIPHLSVIAEYIRNNSSNGGAAGGGYAGVNTLETKFLIRNCYQTTELTNTSNGHAILYIWKCMYRRDIAYNGSATNSTNYKSPLWLLGDGFYQRSFGAVGGFNNNGVTDCDLSPYDSHKFCSEIKIIKQTRHVMESGEHMTISIKRQRPIMINMNHYFTPTAATGSYVNLQPDYSHRRGEMFYLIRIEGQPANDSSNINSIYYTSPKVNMITKTHYNFHELTPNLPILINGGAVGYTAPTTGESLMQDEAGVKVQETNA